MGSDPIPRVLRKQIEGDYFTSTSEGLSPTAGVSTGQYTLVATTGGPEIIVHRTSIDLSGYTRQKLTFYPTSVIIQQGEIDNFFTAGAVGNAYVWDLVTTTPVTDEDLIGWQIHVVGQTQAVPGFSRSNFSLQEIVYGRLRLFSLNSNVPDYFVQTQQKEWGLLSETAGHSLYLTRVILPYTGVTGTISIPEVAFVVTGVTSKEKDLIYVQQLRRVFELQQS